MKRERQYQKTSKTLRSYVPFLLVIFALFSSFCSSRPNVAQLDEINFSNEWDSYQLIPSPVNSPEWEDGPSISPNGRILYFSRGRETREIKSYVSRKINGGWSEPKPLNINLESFPTGAPHSQDDKILYFASLRPGTIGLADIYVCRKVNGQWREVKNLGKSINTKDMESEPFISFDNRTLYFASTRKGGMGKADIWMAKKSNKGWGNPVNLGHPVNSKFEETQPFVTQDGKELYFTAMNRNGVGGPAIFRSIKKGKTWGDPEVVVSGFVGEPTLTADKQYLYFVHLKKKGSKLLDGEIMFLQRKQK